MYHACDSLLHGVDAIQDRLLDHLGITAKQALFEFHLAPLSARRDIPMLGLVHKAVLGKAPPQFSQFFKLANSADTNVLRHKLQLVEIEADVTDFMYPSSRGAPADYIARSALGLCAEYNMLPASIVECSPTVAGFQASLQILMKSQAERDNNSWNQLFSPRWNLSMHPLRSLLQ